MIRRLICRLRGHKTTTTKIRRGELRATVVGCTRCDTMLGMANERLPRMTVPRG